MLTTRHQQCLQLKTSHQCFTTGDNGLFTGAGSYNRLKLMEIRGDNIRSPIAGKVITFRVN